MTLADLVANVGWRELKASLLWLSSEVEADLREYQKVFRSLKTKMPVPDDMRIHIEKRPSLGESEEVGFEVVGRDGTLNRELEDFAYFGAKANEEYGNSEVVWSLCLKPWANWLGMQIGSETSQSFMPAQIVAHCMWEMTFHGYSEAEVSGLSAELDRRVAEMGTMTKEE